ncbi:hypothetical protein ABT063_15595 [Streptomyces sp. NPDC002838]|uniref:hypothetical protein n=1 Tax=Streptomyces sp. NPDC002838 TaxID=3154436 RepID=UPI003322D4BD
MAELKLDQAEDFHASAGSETAVTELRIARAGAHTARDRLRQLRTRYAAEQAAGRARQAAEGGFPEKERKAVTKRLETARDEAVAAVVAAQRAAAEVLVKVAAYDVAVRAVAAELKGRGLSADDGHDLGGTAGGVVHLGGEVWRPADSGALLGAVMQAAVAERDPRHPLAQMRWQQVGGLAEKTARDELLARAVER